MRGIVRVLVICFLCIALSGCSVLSVVTGEKEREETVHAALVEQTAVQEDAVPRSEAVEAGRTAANVLQKRVSWKILKAERETCSVEFTAPDMYQIVGQAYDATVGAGAVSDDPVVVLTEEIIRILESGAYPTVTQTVQLQMENGQPVLDEAAYDAMYGGLLTTARKIEEAAGGVQ